MNKAEQKCMNICFPQLSIIRRPCVASGKGKVKGITAKWKLAVYKYSLENFNQPYILSNSSEREATIALN